MLIAAVSILHEETNNFVSSCKMQLPYLVLLQAPRNNFLYAAVNCTVVGFVHPPRLARTPEK